MNGLVYTIMYFHQVHETQYSSRGIILDSVLNILQSSLSGIICT